MIPNCRRIFGAHAPHPTPENRTPPPRFPGDPGSAVLAHAFDEWARSGPRRRPTNSHPTKSSISQGPRVWATWPPNLSQPIGIIHLAHEVDRLLAAVPHDCRVSRLRSRHHLASA